MLHRPRPAGLRRAGTAELVTFSCAASARISALLLGGLIAAYAASRTTGIPLLDPDSEAVDAVGVAAISIELVSLAFALWLSQPIGRHGRWPALQEVTR